ncbi:MAG: lysylphosphatidylglycerol synthase transmembrane domain-containing protein [Thermodesulfobacteriota bacterium]
MKKILQIILKIGVSGGIMYFLFRGMDMQSFWATISSVKLSSVIIGVVMLGCIQMISSFRWSIILSKDVKLPYPRLLSIYFIGMFFNNFLPTIVGGDLLKGYYLYKESGKGGLALASVFMDRYAGFSALMLITFIAVLFGNKLVSGTGLAGFFILLLGGYLAASLVIWVGFLHSWAMNLMSKVHFYSINEKIDKFYKVLMSYKSHKDILVKAFICSLVVQSGVTVIHYILGTGLGINVSIGYYFLFIPLAAVASMVPISLAGLGIREGVFIFLFAKAGVPQEQALSLSLLFFFITVTISLIGGVEYVRLGGKKDMEAASEADGRSV